MNRRQLLSGLVAMPLVAKLTNAVAATRDMATMAKANLRFDLTDCCTGCVYSRVAYKTSTDNGATWQEIREARSHEVSGRDVCVKHCTHNPCMTYEGD